MGRVFQPAQLIADTGVPLATYGQYKSGETFLNGAPLVYESGEVKEASTLVETALVVGVAAQPAGSAPGQDLSFSSLVTVVTGLKRNIVFFAANRSTVFSGRLTNGATDNVTPLISYVGVSYGVARQSSGEWTVDINETTDVAVKIVGFDPYSPVVYFKWLEAVLANP